MIRVLIIDAAMSKFWVRNGADAILGAVLLADRDMISLIMPENGFTHNLDDTIVKLIYKTQVKSVYFKSI